MKKLLLSSIFISCWIFGLSQNGQIENGSFENWTNTIIFENPDMWMTSNGSGPAFYGVSKSTDAQQGSYSCKLESEISGTDTIISYSFLGHVGQAGPDGGIPYTSTFDQIFGFYKSSMAMNDSAMVLLIRWNSGIPSYYVFLIGGTTSSWTPFSFNLPAGTQDSLFIGLASGNPFAQQYTNTNSSVLFDNIGLNYTMGALPQPLPNAGFETWNSVSIEDPDQWNTINALGVGLGITMVRKTTDKYAGTYAAELETTLFNGTDTVPGILNAGPIQVNQNPPFALIPYTAVPATFSGAYKYSPQNGDNAVIMLQFFSGGNYIGGHQEVISGTISSYQTFSAPLTIAGTPDSLLLLIISGNNPGSVLKVDELSLSGGNVGILDLGQFIKINAWPNPVEDVLHIQIPENESEIAQIEIINLSGQIIQVIPTNGNSGLFEINTTQLSPGIYFYSVANGTNRITGRFIVK